MAMSHKVSHRRCEHPDVVMIFKNKVCKFILHIVVENDRPVFQLDRDSAKRLDDFGIANVPGCDVLPSRSAQRFSGRVGQHKPNAGRIPVFISC